MRVKSIQFTRKFNLGNFESQDINLAAELEEGDDINIAIQKLKKIALENSGKE